MIFGAGDIALRTPSYVAEFASTPIRILFVTLILCEYFHFFIVFCHLNAVNLLNAVKNGGICHAV